MKEWGRQLSSILLSHYIWQRALIRGVAFSGRLYNRALIRGVAFSGRLYNRETTVKQRVRDNFVYAQNQLIFHQSYFPLQIDVHSKITKSKQFFSWVTILQSTDKSNIRYIPLENCFKFQLLHGLSETVGTWWSVWNTQISCK